MKTSLKMVNITNIIPYENNPRLNDDAVEAVAKSIEDCGYIQPIIVDENYIILAGHTRLKALQRLGIKETEIVIVSGLSEEQKKKFRYLDNKTGEAAEWDIEKLTEELEKFNIDEEYFFNMQEEDFELADPPEYTGATEYDLEDFDEEYFEYECPHCGFRFNE